MTPASERDAERLQEPLAYERVHWSRGRLWVAGVDEVGRGPLAGPVVAAAVVLHTDRAISGAMDSKKLGRVAREVLCQEVVSGAAAVALGAASVREIDHLNILEATTLAMRRALARLPKRPDAIVVDGRPVKRLGWEHDAVVGGDGFIHSVSCASIVAKVCRDDLMRKLAIRYPGYGWETNVGYGTQEHRDAIRFLGPTPHHRRSFAGVQLDLGVQVRPEI